MLSEPLMYVTRMTRCKECGMGFASANQMMGTEALELVHTYVEMCPAGHVHDDYVSLDYYFV
jgi:hypothetical protein